MLTKVVIDEGMTYICPSMFADCTSLSEVIIPSTATKIYDLAFANCTALGWIEIPASVTTIGANAFQNCAGLTARVYPGSAALKYCQENGIAYVVLPQAILSAQAEQMKTQLESTGVIRRVDIEPRTGSVLILYDEAAVQAPVVMGAAMKLMGLDEKASAVPAGKLREGLRTLMSAINAGGLDATGGLVDAKTLAAGILTVAALRSRAKIGWAMPGALTLLWWASGLLGAHGYE